MQETAAATEADAEALHVTGGIAGARVPTLQKGSHDTLANHAECACRHRSDLLEHRGTTAARARHCPLSTHVAPWHTHLLRWQVVGVTGHQKGKHTYRWYTAPPEVLAAARASRPPSRVQGPAGTGELSKRT